MSTFKTQAEIYQALLDGKKIKYVYNEGYIWIKDGLVVDQNGDPRHFIFCDCIHWSIYEPPKPMKRVEFKAVADQWGNLKFTDIGSIGGMPRVHNLRIEDGKLIGEVEGD